MHTHNQLTPIKVHNPSITPKIEETMAYTWKEIKKHQLLRPHKKRSRNQSWEILQSENLSEYRDVK